MPFTCLALFSTDKRLIATVLSASLGESAQDSARAIPARP